MRHQPATYDPGGQVLRPLLTVQQKAVQPLPQEAPSPQTCA
jgi:hypothetical protein